MKPIVKYPSPNKKNTAAYYKKMPPRDSDGSSFMLLSLIFIGFLIFCLGFYSILSSLFIQGSVQNVFHGILFALTGAIFIYIASHDRFVTKKQIKQNQ
ncbi:MAG: hypothetical protein COB02_06285 [Candidatus Cloacimonadota bacterium]|nr:MAG: hypothetical protein COB02_06285 [Candidatus Cloacimonadota bacterium]